MANTAQSDLNALSTILEADSSITNAQKAQVQSLMFAASASFFGNAAIPVSNGHLGNTAAPQRSNADTTP